MSNVIRRKSKEEEDRQEDAPDVMPGSDAIEVHTYKLFELNLETQDAVREFVLHDVDDREGLEEKRLKMHEAFSRLYQEIATFTDELTTQDFDIALLKDRIQRADDESKGQLEEMLKTLQTQAQNSIADAWMARVMAWLHQAASIGGPFVSTEHGDRKKIASKYFASVITMLDRSFTAVASDADGAQKLRAVALGKMAYSLLSESGMTDKSELCEIESKNKVREAEFHDEFLNELIALESKFRQAFNPFDEIIWKDILNTYIFEQAADLYTEAIPCLEKSNADPTMMATIKAWKQNTAGLAEVYLAMTYTDIADAQMRAGNLEDASKLYLQSSEAFGRAEKLFSGIPALQNNALQSRMDREHKRAQALFCKAESAIRELSDLLKVDNKAEAAVVLSEIFKDLHKAEKLSKTRELTAAIRENLKIFSFVEDKLKDEKNSMRTILDQIELAQSIRREGLMQSISKALDTSQQALTDDPAEALETIREGLVSLGILLSLDGDEDEVVQLRYRTLALLANLKYVIQFRLSSQLGQGVKFILSRILENMHAEEASTYLKILGERERAEEMMDMGRLALATAYASEAQAFGRQSDQWALRTHLERTKISHQLEAEAESIEQIDTDLSVARTIEAHDNTIRKIRHAIASFEAASKELDSVVIKSIRKKNNVDAQIKQIEGVILKLKGDLSRIEGAKSDFIAELSSKKGDYAKARRFFSTANDQLREAFGNYTAAAQVFQAVGDLQSAQLVDSKARTADLLARSVWENGQKLSRDQQPTYKGDAELIALYLAMTGQ